MAARHIRETVEHNRQEQPPTDDSINLPDEAASPKTPAPGTPPLTPATSSLKPESEDKSLTSRTQQNLTSVMQFISTLSAQSAKTPALPLDAILDDLGWKRDNDEDDDSHGDSSSSFSFNMDTSSNPSVAMGHSTVTNLVRELRRAANSLARFSNDLAHRSVFTSTSSAEGAAAGARRRRRASDDEETALIPWVGHATIMFVDLSGYSKIAAHLTNNGGAHALSTAVNAYFETILTVVVEQYSGEVLSFAGDAIVAAWPCVAPRTPQESGLLAAACALDLQRKCGMSPVPGTDLAFRLHIGITHGEIESQILTSRTAASMQGAYQYVSGKPLEETVVVDSAGEGQVCITEDVFTVCGTYIEATPLGAMPKTHGPEHVSTETTPTLGATKRVFVLSGIDDDYTQLLEKGKPVEAAHREPRLEQKLVPPSVAKKLRQGFKASQMAEMRYLCVLFIKKRHRNVNVAEWFAEVQSILDECRCPIVQILDDDKGTHLVAAVNLYQTERDPAAVALTAASRLVNRETGCSIGVAYGEVFCGITGSETACRWDITGPAVVRACRLMQYAETKGVEAIIDDSVHKVAVDISQLEELADKVSLKGALEPVTAYTLLPAAIAVTSGIQAIGWASHTLHQAARDQLFNEMFNTEIQRGIVVVKGPIGSGKRTMLNLALDRANIRFFVHQCTRDQRPLSVVASLAEWYTYHEDKALATIAHEVLQAFRDGKLTKTLESAHRLVAKIIALGIRACIVVAYAHFIDDASLAFMKSVVTTKPTEGTGRFLFAATWYYLHGVRPIMQIFEGIKRSLMTNERFGSPRVQTKPVYVFINYPTTTKEFGEALAGLTFFQMREQSLQILLEATGGCLALLPTIVEAIHADRAHKDGGFATTIDGTLHITSKGEDYLMTEIYWPREAPDVTRRFMEVYDALPPRLQLTLRVTASMSTTTGSAGIPPLAAVMARLNPKITEDMVRADVEKLKSHFILMQYGREDEEEVCCTVPAMTDLMTSLLTPDQDKLLKRHSHNMVQTFLSNNDAQKIIPVDHWPVFLTFLARVARAAGATEMYKRYIRDSWAAAQKPEAANNLEKVELRMFVEHRRFPHLVNAELFAGITPLPSLAKLKTPAQLELDALEVMPSPVTFGKDYMPPIALGAISGEMQRLCWFCCNNTLDVTKQPDRIFLSDAFRSALKVDLDAVMEAFAKFERIVPAWPADEPWPKFPDEPTHGSCPILDDWTALTPEQERKLLEEFQVPSTETRPAICKAAKFRAYHFRVLLPRVERMKRHVKSLVSPDMMCQNFHGDNGPLKRALTRLLRPCPVPESIVHEALMDLATAGWQSSSFAVDLQLIRDTVLRRRTVSALDFKAFLFSLKVFGEELTNRGGTRYAE